MPLELFTMCSFIQSESVYENKTKVTKWKIENRNWNELLFHGFNTEWNEKKYCRAVFVVNFSIARVEIDFLMICSENPLKVPAFLFCTWPAHLFIICTTRVGEKVKRKGYHSIAPVVIIYTEYIQGRWYENAIECNIMQSLYNSLF